jgi:8-oxo-dGTP pyrophosphatase MutT (NUDIX family)
MTTILSRTVGTATSLYNRALKASRRGRWPLTLGVRVVVLDGQDNVLLVRHTYAPGWHFPGGAVDRREAMADAAARELREEALLVARGEPLIHGIYLSLTENKSDHIGLYLVREWDSIEGKARLLEIAEARFFPAADLPKGTTGGTRRRLAELLYGVPKSLNW